VSSTAMAVLLPVREPNWSGDSLFPVSSIALARVSRRRSHNLKRDESRVIGR
jgi:hypothetical protein